MQLYIPDSQVGLQEQCTNLLRNNDWRIERNKSLAPSPKGGFLRADIHALNVLTGRQIVVYPRWQASSGTAEEKLPFQLIKFEMALTARPDCADAAYFVLEGAGWTWRDFYISGELYKYLPPGASSRCISLSKFSELVRSREL